MMVIVGLMTGAVVVLTPPKTPSVVDAARKTATVLTAIKRQSVMSGQVYALAINNGSLDVRTQSSGEWSKVTVVKPEANSFISQASVSIGGVPYTSAAVNENERFVPQLWFLSTGEFQPFLMTAREGGRTVTLTAEPGRAITVTADD